MKRYANHPSTVKIKSYIFDIRLFNFPEARREDINATKKSLNPNKAIGPDLIPPKIINATANVADAHLTSIINVDLKANKYSKSVKITIDCPI